MARHGSISRQTLGTAALLLAAGVIGASYVWLAYHHGRPWLWDTIVHENGRLTLAGTIFYFEHFLRELPVDVSMGLFLAAALGGLSSPRAGRMTPIGAWAGIAALVLAAGSLAFVISRDGALVAWSNLSQHVVRDGVEPRAAHWHAHWLPLLWFGCIGGLSARIGWLWFGLASVVFGVGLETFTSPWMLGHQSRELLTHALMTLPIVVFAVAALAPPGSRLDWRLDGSTLTRGAVVIALPIGLASWTIVRGGPSHAQLGMGWAGAIAAHFFEHTLDYLMTTLTALWALDFLAPRSAAARSGDSR